jgi:hypothetical protein
MVVEAIGALGWDGEVVGPLSFGGTRFWATARFHAPQDLKCEKPKVQLVGCLIAGTPPGVVRAASLLAAYAPRAVLVDQRQDLTGLLVDAAVLDQGVVTSGPGGIQVLATAGPRVSTRPTSDRERRLHDEVLRVGRQPLALRAV